jgi:hypothetical protein
MMRFNGSQVLDGLFGRFSIDVKYYLVFQGF